MAQLTTLSALILLFFLQSGVTTFEIDDLELDVRNGITSRMLREMVNQTEADNLGLPANATSIRENITDTFSCDNRTYGYYADVDNDCQIFHVCLPSQTASGRNVTYKWSFICPNETIFNQEVLVCTRPRDSIDCSDSPMYYDRNDDIGKVNETSEIQNNTESYNNDNKHNITVKIKSNKTKRKEMAIKKQNLILENTVKENIERQIFNKPIQESLPFYEQNAKTADVMSVKDNNSRFANYEYESSMTNNAFSMDSERILTEQSNARRERKIRPRGLFKFISDI